MEAASLILPGFWAADVPLMMGAERAAPRELPGLVYFRSSGSTGEPKWIGLGRRALLASAAAVNTHLQVDAASTWALALPLVHVGGFGVAARAWQAGCRLAVFGRKWSAPGFVSWLSSAGASHLALVPTQVHDLVAAGAACPRGLRAVVVGGGALDPATGCAARDLGWPVLASYGMTEAGSQVATQRLELLDTPFSPQPLDILPCWDVRSGHDGRLELRGEALFDGWLVREGRDWSYRERRGDWFVTSDTGDIAAGRLRLGGRADALVKILGELVDPLAVEAELRGAVGAALPPAALAVVAVPDVRTGMRLVLVHGPELAAARLDPALAAYHAVCPGFRRIGAVVALPSMPTSPLGKPLRAELSRIAAEAVN
jgi:O-succinylbenzoic acid--CoA ligase